LLLKEGWNIDGITLWLLKGKGACCSDGLIDAAEICEQLGINHHIVDSRDSFEEEIINGITDGYQQGQTPLPCSICNKRVKFQAMLEWASKQKNFTFIATGHYARVKHAYSKEKSNTFPTASQGRHKLLRGKDQNKDQSYFLYDLTQETLGRVIFPLGELTKNETRSQAKSLGLKTATKPESQDLCLIENYGSMTAFLDHYIPKKSGEIIHIDGKILGHHDGIHHFTIGQRKGLKVAWHEPLYVIKLDPISNKVIVASRSEAGKSECSVKEINWVSIDPPLNPMEVEVQIRYRTRPVKALLTPFKDSKSTKIAKLNFYETQFSVTPGQAAVFYEQDLLLGGGIIEIVS
tara:strand:- start:12846 stop:13889 length:1044 start_codon:yes stop_codon:yes gene_type:complete